ncbi:MAG: glycogen synthase GlgA [Candidatus Omnitrophica bacterium]|nr:glycogen synthase GlgA [Candidatus Omnitrophota bacterium]
MNIVFCASEVYPFAKTGGLADVCGSLPLALEKLGHNVSIFMPFYKEVANKNLPLEKIRPDILHTTLGDKVDVYFLIHDQYFMRDGIYADGRGDYGDNLDRYQYFCQKVLDTLRDFETPVDIIHCHDWQTALIPVYLKHWYNYDTFYAQTKTLLTIHNIAYQGVFPKHFFGKLHLGPELFHPNLLEFYGSINLLKAGIICSHEITTVSPQYAKEIQTKEFGNNLDNVLRHNRQKVMGVLNGLDYQVWNPTEDKYLEHKYSVDNYKEGKALNKLALQQRLHLPQRPEVPLFGVVSRLSHQKGFDLILQSLHELMSMDIQLVIQGLGQQDLVNRLKWEAGRYNNKFAVAIEFAEDLAHKIYAGCDMFLMPSLFEPCGLSQMIALKYGTIPLVSYTGGLVDTVTHYNKETGLGNGFLFERNNKGSFVWNLRQAVDLFHQKEHFEKLVANAFRSEFAWDSSAKQYVEIYKCLLSVSQVV